MEDINKFYKGKRVFITGHTGFKGSWLCKMLSNAGAVVTGYPPEPPTSPSLFKIANIEDDVHFVIGDIRDYASLKKAFDEAQPKIVLHLALRGRRPADYPHRHAPLAPDRREEFLQQDKEHREIFGGMK